jgi:peptidoglycan pentaglycine glycine transferase (the first glycine)
MELNVFNEQVRNLRNQQIGSPPFDDQPSLVADRAEGLRCEISHKLLDPEWDSFVAGVPLGNHFQSSPWAGFKASSGWSPIRIMIRKGSRIVAGVQVLVRSFLGTIKIAHVVQGPVLSSHEPELFETVLDELAKLIRADKIVYLAMHPAYDCGAVDMLEKHKFHARSFISKERATLIIDLSQDSRELLRKMRRTTRNNIRLGCDQGIRILNGKDTDIAVFHKLLAATGRRHTVTLESEEYLKSLWKHLEPLGHIRLFLAEYQGEILSGLLVIPFGNTVTMKKLAWGGSQRWLRPNELLIWKAIEWSKEKGFRYFDINGINIMAARALLSGKPLPEFEKQRSTRFVLGFRGSVVLLPAGYEYTSNRVMSSLFNRVDLIVESNKLNPILQRILST